MVEVIEGEAVEVIEPVRALVPAQPGQVIVAAGDLHPEHMIATASRMAAALKDIVERQKLYATISGKKYPQVEAWATIGRLDNVVAREASKPIRQDDGSYEAEVELVRLSDGMVIGRASALCGMPDDRPWATRAEYARRSMAVTRATSRAFRQHYSWIMALAGYEPTPADEMPHDPEERPETPRSGGPVAEGGLTGEAVTQGNQDYQLREGPDGAALPFRVKVGRRSQICVAHDDLARTLALLGDQVIGKTVTVWGHQSEESFDKKENGEVKTVRYTILHVDRIQTPEWVLPSASVDAEPSADMEVRPEAPSTPMFDEGPGNTAAGHEHWGAA